MQKTSEGFLSREISTIQGKEKSLFTRNAADKARGRECVDGPGDRPGGGYLR